MKTAVQVLARIVLLPALAVAQSPAETSGKTEVRSEGVPATMTLIKADDVQAPLVPRAKDVVGSHVLVGAAVGPVWSFGRFDSETTAARGFGTGLGFQADAGIGLSRAISVGAWGSYGTFSDGSGCVDCAGRAFAIGPFVRYHLSQGLRFSPWLSAGAGYRQLSFLDDIRAAKQKYSGIEWLRLDLGADYYLFSGFGFGPYGTLSISSYTTRPSGAGDARANTELSAGLRLLLDLPGR
jgi:hypothetical protein